MAVGRGKHKCRVSPLFLTDLSPLDLPSLVARALFHRPSERESAYLSISMSLRLTVASSLSQRPRILSNLVVLAKFFAVCQRLSMPLVFPFHARLSRMNVLPEIAPSSHGTMLAAGTVCDACGGWPTRFCT